MLTNRKKIFEYKIVYWYWWKFLQLSKQQGFEWSDLVKEHFGDPDVPFKEWWLKHKHLFWKPEPYLFRELQNYQDFDDYDPEIDLRLTINLLATQDEILKAIGKEITKRASKKVGKPKLDDWSDLFELHHRPKYISLKRTLRIWLMYQEPKAKRLNQVEMYRSAKLSVKQGKEGIEGKKGKEFKEEPDIDTIRAVVSRHRREALVIMENVANGLFPKRNFKVDEDDAKPLHQFRNQNSSGKT